MLNPGFAREILHTDDTRLEANTRKLKYHCHDELAVMSSSGVLKPSGLLRSSLLSAALMLSLDTQELESLNSMMKMAMLRANTATMTLELLCSRVCLRKVVATMSGNSARFKEVAPIAANVARSCSLHWANSPIKSKHPAWPALPALPYTFESMCWGLGFRVLGSLENCGSLVPPGHAGFLVSTVCPLIVLEL